MANLILGAPLFNDVGVLHTPTYSGGSWEAGNPLNNLRDRRMFTFARSVGVTEAATQFTCDLQTVRPVRVVMIPRHTLSSAGKWRVRGFVTQPILDAPDFATGWTAVNTPTRVAAADTASDGVPIDLIGDDSGAAMERYSRPITFTGDGQKVMAFRAKQGTSTLTSMEIFDTTAVAIRLRVTITWTAGVPTTIGFSPGSSLISSTLIGNGVYRFVCLSSAVTAANSHIVYAEGSSSIPANTGTSYVGDVMVWNATTDQLAHDSGLRNAWAAGDTLETRQGQNLALVSIVPATAQQARFWLVQFSDTTNAAGYLDLHRLCLAGGFQPSTNFSEGSSFGLESDSVTTYADGGNGIHDVRPLRRVARFSTRNVEMTEALTQFLVQQVNMGARGQCVVVPDPDDAQGLMQRRAFLAVPRELTALEYTQAAFGHYSIGFVEEL